MSNTQTALLQLKDLTVTMQTVNGPIVPVNHLNISLYPGKTLGIVGESGSGKSTTAYAIMQLLSGNASCSGEVLFEGRNLLKLSPKEMARIRGQKIGMIFQEPIKYLDPSFQIGQFLSEVLRTHFPLSRKEAAARSREMLLRVGFPDPDTVLKSYPSELSGGMCQRIMIAMILLLAPEIIIADEPTTALDVTIQDGIIELLKRICKEEQKTMLFVTHNFGLVAELCDTVCVMYGGSIVESGKTEDIFTHPAHPYTKGLLNAIPSVTYQGKQVFHPIEGKPIELANMPEGCAFAPRCTYCKDICRKHVPEKVRLESGQEAACWLYHNEVAL